MCPVVGFRAGRGSGKRGWHVEARRTMTNQPAPACVFPSCAGFGAPLVDPFNRFCPMCARPLGGATVGHDPGLLVEAYVGSGFYADVFGAVDLDTHVRFATKIYRDDVPRREAARREIEALQTL